ncbi:hypothetical protein BU24DRAFT_466013 [Aaosphaeria arxii CBS 175.79]|uniref:Uncharacterized protein n=1 Tax=Aaosphaeria arxii CBS 175.79 TaxID=1450172 RepID=A0A6A5XEF8_9PLEO|nr:uncharacterized protein BU24DRAFT_466013 [Aaosphaeria arxii CBS 175.79]KAF2011283.1 hypothetical protein BU24DRAFT_466013 [Aaosphaeria arxii CBS 175.79]
MNPRVSLNRPYYGHVRASIEIRPGQTIETENQQTYLQMTDFDKIARADRELSQHTLTFIEDVKRLSRLPGSFPHSALLLLDFTINVLRRENSCFQHMLNSRRTNLYWSLDQAFLSICMDEWENRDSNTLPWSQGIQPLLDKMNEGYRRLGEWSEKDRVSIGPDKDYLRAPYHMYAKFKHTVPFYLCEWWFKKSRDFLEDSLKAYYLRKKVNACLGGRLPIELAEVVIEEVSEFEMKPVRLRQRYFPNSKGKKKI